MIKILTTRKWRETLSRIEALEREAAASHVRMVKAEADIRNMAVRVRNLERENKEMARKLQDKK